MARETTSKNFDGIADLVVVAPIREGFIEAFENVTYATRLRIVAEALHNVRVSAREHERTVPFSDTTERILTLLDFRIGVLDRGMFALGDGEALESRRYLYLTATFDGPLEPYMRLIWNPLGAFLDLLFCNCEGYVPACDNSFEDYLAWVRSAQVDSAIFYSTTGLTVKDQLYLRNLERLQREVAPPAADLAIAMMTMPDPEVAAAADRGEGPGTPAERMMAALRANTLALEALSVLYRLADYYPPDRIRTPRPTVAADRPTPIYAEGRYLLRATQSLLSGWKRELPAAVRARYAEQLKWFETDPAAILGSTQVRPDDPAYEPAEIQAGIMSRFGGRGDRIERGALLLMTSTAAEPTRDFLATLLATQPGQTSQLSFEGDKPDAMGFLRTIAFSAQGLETIGIYPNNVDRFPKEFREGMEKRSGLIGDYRENHPRNWILPERNWPPAAPDIVGQRPPVDPSEIDFVIQLRLVTDPAIAASVLDTRLNTEIKRLADAAAASGAVLVGYEPMVSNIVAAPGAGSTLTREHFGFVDGLSQPRPQIVAGDDKTTRPPDIVRLGEVLMGYRNDHGDYAWADDDRLTDFRFNGSFLVIRKIEQFPELFAHYLETEPKRIFEESGIRITARELAAKLMGRTPDGDALVANPPQSNDFDYSADTTGEICPFASHVRRTNPREPFEVGAAPLHRPAPRLMRRGMSFGKFGDASARRGLIFMAYGASIAEQFEVVQRWINGGNSTNISAAQNDPILGVRPAKGKDVYRFIHNGQVVRTELPGPFTKLHWGAYLFAPSRKTLAYFADRLRGTDQVIEDPNEARGARIIRQLGSLPPELGELEWQRILQDFDSKDPEERSITPDVMSAIRWYRGGSYRIKAPEGAPAGQKLPSGISLTGARVLVASETHMLEVLSDPVSYSVEMQGQRIKDTAGPIYVAMQPDTAAYKTEAPATNAVMYALDEAYGFEAAFRLATARLRTLVGNYEALPPPARADKAFKIELRRDFLLPALGDLCTEWFGLPDDVDMENRGWSWSTADEARLARCPGDFLSPSRHAFYPEPTEWVEAYARDHGARIAAAGKQFVTRLRAGQVAGAGLSQAMAAKITDDDVLARNIIGMMIGALPPIDGNLRGILLEWINERSLWRHQAAMRRAVGDGPVGPASLDAAREALKGPVSRAICKRPAPDLLYRVATTDATLVARGDENDRKRKVAHEDVKIEPGDLIIISQASAAQRSLRRGVNGGDGDPSLVFGGNRTSATQATGPTHACPAQKLMMGTMAGLMAALLDAGRIQALPSALIVQLSGWRPGYGKPPEPATGAVAAGAGG